MTTDLISELLTTNPELTIYEFNQIIHGEKKDTRPVHTGHVPKSLSFHHDKCKDRSPVNKVVKEKARVEGIELYLEPPDTRPAAEYSNKQW